MQNNIIVDICNEAINEAGMDTTISALDENSNLAELCSRLWAGTLRQMYTEHSWAFREVKVQAQLVTSGTMNEFSYPDSALRIEGFYLDLGCQVPEKLARVGTDTNGIKKIYNPHAPLFIKYLVDSTSNDSLSPWLRQCLVTLLAAKIYKTKGGDDTKLLQKYQYLLDKAEENNSSESESTNTYDDRFIDCR